jgi:2-haloalkanoic acid dehalogenase type II
MSGGAGSEPLPGGEDDVARLSDFEVLSFDCYGTLIDWESGLLRALEPIATASPQQPSETELLQSFAIHESEQQRQTPGMLYADVLAAVHERLCRQWGVAAAQAEHAAFGRSIESWPAFPDSVAALAYLKRHYKLFVLSNVDRASFAHSNARLEVEFDGVYTAEEIGSYKPDVRNFQYLIGQLEARGFARGRVLHVAQSLFHDHVPAQSLGLRTAWIDRQQGKPGAVVTPPGDVAYDFRFAGMAALAHAHRDELAARSPR